MCIALKSAFLSRVSWHLGSKNNLIACHFFRFYIHGRSPIKISAVAQRARWINIVLRSFEVISWKIHMTYIWYRIQSPLRKLGCSHLGNRRWRGKFENFSENFFWKDDFNTLIHAWKHKLICIQSLQWASIKTLRVDCPSFHLDHFQNLIQSRRFC